MNKVVFFLTALLIFQIAYAELGDKETTGVGVDFQGVLNLTITSDPQVDFNFKTIEDYQRGIVKYNAVKMEIDATSAWDLYAYANTDNFQMEESYSFNGETTLPAEILEIESSVPNESDPAGGNFNTFRSLKGLTHSGVVGGLPDANSTQFIAGMVGMGQGKSNPPGSAKANPETNQISLHYKIVPGPHATFPHATVAIPGAGYAQNGNYYLEVVYALVEDL